LPTSPPEKAWQFGNPAATLNKIAVVPVFPRPNMKIFMLILQN
jgi:hypothetical protein